MGDYGFLFLDTGCEVLSSHNEEDKSSPEDFCLRNTNSTDLYDRCHEPEDNQSNMCVEKHIDGLTVA